jgi:hypothetical protein
MAGFSRFVTFSFSSFDENVFKSSIKNNIKPDLDKHAEVVSGFIPIAGTNDYHLKGDAVCIYACFVKEEHTYGSGRLKKLTYSAYMKILEEKGFKSDKEVPKDQSKNKEGWKKDAVEKAMASMRQSNATDIKESKYPILISTSKAAAVLFVGASSTDDNLPGVAKTLSALGFSGLELEGKMIDGTAADQIYSQCYTSFLMDSETIMDCAVPDPILPDGETIPLELGGNCELIQSGSEKELEGAVFKNFDLEEREEIISLLKSGKVATKCQFRFDRQDERYFFTHDIKGNYTSVKKGKKEGDKNDQEKSKDLEKEMVKLSYIFRMIRSYVNKMVDMN